MADAKISALAAATTPVAGTEVLPIVQSGATVKVSINNLTTGKSVPASSFVANSRTTYGAAALYDAASPTGNAVGIAFGGSATVLPCNGSGSPTNNTASLGSASFAWKNLYIGDNIIQTVAAKGINFTANTPAAGMTSQLLNWYEEGTWTPTVTSSSGTITSVTDAAGYYTRVGRMVTVTFVAVIANNGTGAGYIEVGGIPFNVGSGFLLNGAGKTAANLSLNVGVATAASFALYKYDGTYPGVTGQAIVFGATYFV